MMMMMRMMMKEKDRRREESSWRRARSSPRTSLVDLQIRYSSVRAAGKAERRVR